METTNAPAVSQQESAALTPEQELELETLKLERAKTEAEVLQAQRESEQLRSEQKAFLAEQNLKDAALAGPKFYDAGLAVTLAKAQYDLRFDDEGQGTGVVNGRRVPLTDVFVEIAQKHPSLVDGRSLRGMREAEDKPPIKARSEMSQAEKIEFLHKFGLEAWEKLPVRPMRTVQVRTMADYLSLPMNAKMQFIEKHGPDAVGRLPRA